MDREEAQKRIKAHERAARDATRPDKRFQHEEAARYLREQFSIPEPTIVKAIPATDFERLQSRLEPHRASKPTDWTNTESYSK
jgi:hypothetical protein